MEGDENGDKVLGLGVIDIGLECEIASNRDPSQIQNNSLIKRGNTQLGWGHDWARHATPSIAIFHNEINALRSLRGGVNVGCDFTPRTHI